MWKRSNETGPSAPCSETLKPRGIPGVLISDGSCACRKFKKIQTAFRIQEEVQEVALRQLLLGLQQPLQAAGIIQDITAASIQEEITIADSTQDVSKSQHQGGCAARILSGSDVRSNVVDNEHKSYCHHKVTGQS